MAVEHGGYPIVVALHGNAVTRLLDWMHTRFNLYISIMLSRLSRY